MRDGGGSSAEALILSSAKASAWNVVSISRFLDARHLKPVTNMLGGAA
jgi:hypothetical protein